jgi:hypothetical protein
MTGCRDEYIDLMVGVLQILSEKSARCDN